MSFAFSANTIVQSSTDTSWSGIDTAIAAVAITPRSTAVTVGTVRKIVTTANQRFWVRCTTAGTTAATEPTWPTATASTVTDGTAVWTTIEAPFSRLQGDLRIYIMHEWVMVITGTTTIADPGKETVEVARFWVRNAAAFTSGSYCAAAGYTTVPKTNGVHFRVVDTAASDFPAAEANASFSVASGAAVTLVGGEVGIALGTWLANGGTLTATGTKFVAQRARGSDSIRFRNYSTGTNLQDCIFYDVGFDMFYVPSTPLSVKARGSFYVYQYVGSGSGGVDAYFSTSALDNPDGTYDFDNWGGGYVEIYNCAKGANLAVGSSGASTGFHCVPLIQQVNLTVTDLSGNTKDDVNYRCVDAPTNSPTVTYTTRSSLKTWDFRNPITYSGATAGGGAAALALTLKVWYGSNQQNLRFPSSTAAILTRGYDLAAQTTNVVLGSDASQSQPVAAPLVPFVTMDKATAAALTGIGLTPSGASGGAVVISESRTVSDLWHYWRNWIHQVANFGSNDTWTYDGTRLNLAEWTMTIDAGDTLTGDLSIGSALVVNGTLTGNLNLTGTGRLDLAAPITLPAGDSDSGTKIRVTGATSGDSYDGTARTFHASSVFENTSGQPIILQLATGQTAPTLLETSGTITISSPQSTLNITGLWDETRVVIYNETEGTVLYDDNVSGTSLAYNYDNGTEITAGDTVRVYYVWYNSVDGSTASKKGRATIVPTSTGGSAAIEMEACTIYAAYYATFSVTGETVYASGDFVRDMTNLQIDLDDADDTWFAHRMFMFDKYDLWFNSGRREAFSQITASDSGNLNIGTLLLDNLNANTAFQGDPINVINSTSTLPVQNPTTGGGGITMYSGGKILTTSTGGIAPSESQIKVWVREEIERSGGLLEGVKSKTDNLSTSGLYKSPLGIIVPL